MGKLPIRRSTASEHSAAPALALASAPPVSAQRKPGASMATGTTLRRAALLGHNVQRIAAGLVQAKLTVGPVGDSYEREADSVAQQVMQSIQSPAPAAPDAAAPAPGGATAQRAPEDEIQEKSLAGAVQREGEDDLQMKPLAGAVQRTTPEDELQKKATPGAVQRAPEDEMQRKPLAGAVQRATPEEELQKKPLSGAVQREGEEDLQMKPLPGAVQRATPEEELQKKPLSGAVQREGEEDLQMKPLAGAVQRDAAAGAAGGPVGADLERSIEGARSGGSPLDAGLRVQMEPAFGADFSGVRVHSDAKSHGLNQSLQARAFTTGQDIFFRGGEYNPGSSAGKELVAHELTHVVQQNGPAVAKKPAE